MPHTLDPVEVSGFHEKVVRISDGNHHSCAVTGRHTVISSMEMLRCGRQVTSNTTSIRLAMTALKERRCLSIHFRPGLHGSCSLARFGHCCSGQVRVWLLNCDFLFPTRNNSVDRSNEI